MGIVRDEHTAVHKFQKRPQRLLLPRCIGHHFVGDIGDLRYFLGNMVARIYKTVVAFGDLAVLDHHCADFRDGAVGR